MLGKKTDSIPVGVLVPQSRMYPSMGLNFLRGIQLYFTLHENEFGGKKVELITEYIGFASEASIMGKLNLILANNVKAVLGWSASHVIEQAAGMAQLANVPLLWTSLGESIPSGEKEFTALHRLEGGLWQAAFHLGEYYSENEIIPPLLLMDFHDSGYDFPSAFYHGLGEKFKDDILLKVTEAGGAFNLTVQEALESVRLKEHQAVISYHTQKWSEHSKTFNEQLARAYKLSSLQEADLSIDTFFSDTFSPVAGSYDTGLFIRGAKEYLNTVPDHFHLLGYELGNWLYQWCRNMESFDRWDDWNAMLETFDQLHVRGLRGDLFYNKEYQLLQPPVFINQKKEGRTRQLRRIAAKDIVTPKSSCVSDLQTIEKSRFVNPYMVI